MFEKKLTSLLSLAVLFGAMTCFSPMASAVSEKEAARIITNTRPLYEACMRRCMENTELAAFTREGCLQGCDHIRRTFRLGKRHFSNREDCLQALDKLELERDLLIQQDEQWCLHQWTHLHSRKGCKDAIHVFYAAATQETLCGPGINATLPPGPAVSPLFPPGYPPHESPSAPVQQSARPSHQSQSLPPAADTLTVEHILANPAHDTPKYQTPAEERRSLKRMGFLKEKKSQGQNTKKNIKPEARTTGKAVPATQSKPVPSQQKSVSAEKDAPYEPPALPSNAVNIDSGTASAPHIPDSGATKPTPLTPPANLAPEAPRPAKKAAAPEGSNALPASGTEEQGIKIDKQHSPVPSVGDALPSVAPQKNTAQKLPAQATDTSTKSSEQTQAPQEQLQPAHLPAPASETSGGTPQSQPEPAPKTEPVHEQTPAPAQLTPPADTANQPLNQPSALLPLGSAPAPVSSAQPSSDISLLPRTSQGLQHPQKEASSFTPEGQTSPPPFKTDALPVIMPPLDPPAD